MEITQHIWGYPARGEREHGQGLLGWGVCFYWDSLGEPGASKTYSLLVNLKHKRRNLKHGEEKRCGPNGHLPESTKISKTKEPEYGEVAWLVIRLAMFVLQWPSLKWMPLQQSELTVRADTTSVLENISYTES